MSKRKQNDDDRESESDSPKRIKTFEDRFSLDELAIFRKPPFAACLHECLQFMPVDVVDIIVSYEFICMRNGSDLEMRSFAFVSGPLTGEGLLTTSRTLDRLTGNTLKTVQRYAELADPISTITLVEDNHKMTIYTTFGIFTISSKPSVTGDVYVWIDEDLNASAAGRLSVPRILFASHGVCGLPDWSFSYSRRGTLESAELRDYSSGDMSRANLMSVPVSEAQFYEDNKLIRACFRPLSQSNSRDFDPIVVCDLKEANWYRQPASKWVIKATFNRLSDTGYDLHVRRDNASVISRITDAHGKVWRCIFLEPYPDQFSISTWAQEGKRDGPTTLIGSVAPRPSFDLPDGFPQNFTKTHNKAFCNLYWPEERLIGSLAVHWRNTIKRFLEMRDDVSKQAIALTRM